MTITNEISNRQLEIIEVSGKILIEKGIKGLTTKTVASEMNFSSGAICLVLASHDFDEEDYIRDYNNYLELKLLE